MFRFLEICFAFSLFFVSEKHVRFDIVAWGVAKGQKARPRLKGVKTKWVQVWTNLISFAGYAVKSKQTYQTSKTITMMWRLEVRYALQFMPVSFHLLPLCINPLYC